VKQRALSDQAGIADHYVDLANPSRQDELCIALEDDVGTNPEVAAVAGDLESTTYLALLSQPDPDKAVQGRAEPHPGPARQQG